MAAEKTITAKLYTPIDETTGERKRILIQTTADNVIDPETGESVKQMIADCTYSEATETESGLMSPTHVKNMKTLMESKIVVSEDDPGVPCMWYQIEGIEEDS